MLASYARVRDDETSSTALALTALLDAVWWGACYFLIYIREVAVKE